MTTQQTASTEDLKNEIANKQAKSNQVSVSPYRKIEAYLNKMKPELEKALPKHIDADRLARISLTTIKLNPKLLDASIESLLGAVLQSASLGLEPDILGSCYFIPFRNNSTNETTVSFQIGYRGMIDLVTRKGEVLTIVANPRYENDVFEIEHGRNEIFRHVPADYENRGAIKGFYAYAHLKNGGFVSTYMSIQEVLRIRDKHSKAYQGAKKYKNESNSIWVEHFEEMSKKTVIKRLVKYLPISVEIQRDLAMDETIRKDITSDEVEYVKVDVEESNVIDLDQNN